MYTATFYMTRKNFYNISNYFKKSIEEFEIISRDDSIVIINELFDGCFSDMCDDLDKNNIEYIAIADKAYQLDYTVIRKNLEGKKSESVLTAEEHYFYYEDYHIKISLENYDYFTYHFIDEKEGREFLEIIDDDTLEVKAKAYIKDFKTLRLCNLLNGKETDFYLKYHPEDLWNNIKKAYEKIR